MTGFPPVIISQLAQIQKKLAERTVKCADNGVAQEVPWFTVPKEETKEAAK
jgi:hypothetical protein